MEFKLPKRQKNSHKGTFGKVLNVAGSAYMPGAAYLSSVSALKVGCGYCFLVSDERTINAVASQTQNIVFVPLKNLKKQLKSADVLSIGCGLSTSYGAVKLFKTAVTNSNLPTIIDADGLNILSKHKTKLPKKLILTPHPTEASRLLGIDTETVQSDREFYAKEISKKYHCVTVLKGYETVISSEDFDVYINTTGNSALAKAGSGDVLTGIIAGFLAQGMDLFEAAKLGVYVHGLAGDLASEKLTKYGVMASDLISYIPKVFKKYF